MGYFKSITIDYNTDSEDVAHAKFLLYELMHTDILNKHGLTKKNKETIIKKYKNDTKAHKIIKYWKKKGLI